MYGSIPEKVYSILKEGRDWPSFERTHSIVLVYRNCLPGFYTSNYPRVAPITGHEASVRINETQS